MGKGRFKIILKLLALVKPLLHIMAITVTMGVIGFLCSIFITILGGYGLVNAFGLSTGIATKTILVTVLLLAVLRGVLRYAEQASGHYIAFRLLAIIRDKVFKALRRLAPAKLEGKDKGNLISIITSDIELLEVFYAHTIAPVTIAIITSGIMLFFIGSFNPVLAVVALLAYITVGYILPRQNSKRGKEDGKQYRNSFGELNSYVLDSLRGLRETIQFNDGQDRLEKMVKSSDELDGLQEKLKEHEAKTKAITDTVILLFSLGMLFTGIFLWSRGIVDFVGVVIPTIAMMSSFGPVVALSNLSNNLLQTLACGERVLAILEEEPEVMEVEGKEEIDFHGISCEEVNFSYDDEKILSDFTIEIPKNKILGITGKSGSGKSTFLKLLMRFWDRDNGDIKVSGKDIKELNTSCLRKIQSYVTQETYLFKDSIEANIKLSRPEATHEEVVEAAKKASIHEFIMSLPEGYNTKVSELGESLSGGERQRLGIARAFLQDSPLLLLDEPTSNLDSLNEGIILKSIKEECKDKTVVLISHRKSTMNIAHEEYSVERGRVS
ncbi:amino acid ABC transporter ATP-binding/permease protein [Alloiococcus sp. CFN-8]|uniref:amino acid ABC transporter ATP-binding/permease protein n=1 Tax=Alloiococcus sp. CFN-8 TaxID=3416081 RepID=UPI003CF4F83A